MEQLLEHLNAKRGRRLELAKALRISPSSISQWIAVPVSRVLEIERLTGIPRHVLRPDVYPALSITEAAE